jgi:hypothetical protein
VNDFEDKRSIALLLKGVLTWNTTNSRKEINTKPRPRHGGRHGGKPGLQSLQQQRHCLLQQQVPNLTVHQKNTLMVK